MPRVSTRRLLALAAVVAFVAQVAIAAVAPPAGAATGDINTVAGTGTAGYNGDGIPAATAELNGATGAVPDSSGNLLIGDRLNNRIRVIAVSPDNPGYPLEGCAGTCTWTTGDIYTIVGTGTGGYNGDGIVATSATIDGPAPPVPDSQGNLLITDTNNNRIRMLAVSATNPGYVLAATCSGTCTWTPGEIFTLAGSGTTGYNGDGIAASGANLTGPTFADFDGAGDILITDTGNNYIRVVAVPLANPGYPVCMSCTWTPGGIYNVVGTGTAGYNNDGNTLFNTQLNLPTVAIPDAQQNEIIVDRVNQRVRVFATQMTNPGYVLAATCPAPSSPCTWTKGDVYTLAGNGTAGYNGDGISAGMAELNNPAAAVTDGSGNVVIGDTDNERVRVVAESASNPGYALSGCGGTCTWTPGDIYTIAGTGAAGFNGDGIAASTAQVSSPVGVLPYGASAANLLIGDTGNNRIRRMVGVSSAMTIPGTTAPVSASITAGHDAVWTVSIDNPSDIPLTDVTATLRANADGSTPLTFDATAMTGCAAGSENSEVCNLSDIDGNDTLDFQVFVPTNSLSVGTTITGDITVSAPGQTDVSGTLDTVTIISCGQACVIAVVKPGQTLSSSAGPPTTTHPTLQQIQLPASQPGAPPVAVTLKSINPGSGTPAPDKILCPATGTRCSGQISVIAGNFKSYTNRAHPVLIRIIAKWATKVPVGRMVFLGGSGGPPEQMPTCVLKLGKYNTPCGKPEVVRGSAATHNLTTTDVILFVGDDPHIARRDLTTPNAPLAVKAAAGKKQATLKWAVPAVTNGKITGYVITPYLGKVAQRAVTFASAATKEIVTGLTSGKSYTFKVAARNAHGLSFQSIASNAVKPT